MSEDKSSRSWWQTLPGILTAIAALITAVGGLLGVLLGAGIIGGGEAPESTRTVATSETSAPEPEQSDGPPATKPWSEVEAVFYPNDGGPKLTARAETVSYCISAGKGLPLASGQNVPFEKMKSINVLRSDELFASGGKADLEITLVDGRTLRDRIDSNCGFIGFNDVGRFEIYPQRLARLEFRR